MKFVTSLIAGLCTRPSLGSGLEVHLTDPIESTFTPALLTAIRTLHSNLGHLSSRALARSIRLTGGSDEAVAAALAYRCPTCVRLKEPKPVNPAKLNDKFSNFSDLVCVDLFTLADINGKNQSFLNCVDKSSGYQLVAPVSGKRPDEVFGVFNRTWLIPFGIPHNVLSDNGGEFEREFSDGLESLGTKILRSASYAPTQNGTTERRGGAWKAHARAVMDEHSIRFNTQADAEHLCAAINWAVNQDIDESGYSPAQWVLG